MNNPNSALHPLGASTCPPWCAEHEVDSDAFDRGAQPAATHIHRWKGDAGTSPGADGRELYAIDISQVVYPDGACEPAFTVRVKTGGGAASEIRGFRSSTARALAIRLLRAVDDLDAGR